MTYNKKTNCEYCYYPLHLQDLKKSQWIGNIEEFIFKCSFCNKETIIRSNLFVDGHVNENYLNVIREDTNYFSLNYLDKIFNHIKECFICKDKFEEGFLDIIENNIKLNDKSLEHFKKYSTQILQELNENEVEIIEDKNGIHIKSFIYDDNKFLISQDDEFSRKTKKLKTIEDIEEIFYHIKHDQYVIGNVSFYIKKKQVVLNKIWFLANDVIKKRSSFFKDLNEGKIKIKLNTLEKIYSKLCNV